LARLTQAARILANLIVAGAGVLLRAGAQAYRQALVSAPRWQLAGWLAVDAGDLAERHPAGGEPA